MNILSLAIDIMIGTVRDILPIAAVIIGFQVLSMLKKYP